MPFLLSQWKLIAVALLIAGAWAYVATITHQRDSARADAAECRVQTEQLIAKVEAQNRAVQALADESKKKTEEALKRLQAARKATAGAQTEAERLRAASKAVGKPSACPAGDAVLELRKGLK